MANSKANTVCSLDANVVLRLLLQDQPAQLAKVMQVLNTARPASLHIADIVFCEAAWVLSGKYYQFNRQQVATMLTQISSLPQVNCHRQLLETALPLYTANPKISFIDACLAVYAKFNQATPLLTFDKQLVAALPHYAKIV